MTFASTQLYRWPPKHRINRVRHAPGAGPEQGLAVYLELARREGLPLATLDKGLRAAAAKAGVPLLK